MSARRKYPLLLGFLIVWAGIGLASGVNAQQIFADGFESGDSSAWFKTRKPGGLDVTGNAAYTGDFGLEILAGHGRTGVEDRTPSRETVFMADFFFNPNNWEMRARRSVDMLQLSGRGRKGTHVRLVLEQTGPNAFELRLLARENSGRYRFVGSSPVPRSGWTQVTVLWARAGTNGLDRGLAALFTNGSLRGERDNLDNGRLRVDAVRLGLPRKANAAQSGSFYLDAFASFRTLSP